MPIVLIILAAIMLVTAIQDTQGDLFSALQQDVPGYAKWAGALLLVGGLGYVPGLRTPSRYLLGLVLTVLVVRNYSDIFKGLQNAFSGSSTLGKTSQTDPLAAYAANPASPNITTAEVQGTTSGSALASNTGASSNLNADAQTATTTSLYGSYDPTTYLHSYVASLAPSTTLDNSLYGFGGVA